MGVPWIAQVRLLHLGILGVATITCLLYFTYITSPQLNTTASPLRLISSSSSSSISAEIRTLQGNNNNNNNNKIDDDENDNSNINHISNNNKISNNIVDLIKNVTTAIMHSVSSEAPPAAPLIPAKPSVINNVNNFSNNSLPDLTRGVYAEVIYEAGHNDVSPQLCPELGKNKKLLIAITSAPSHESARLAIRETWGHFGSRRDIAIGFMLGSTSNETLNKLIEKEQYLYGDIIRGKFIDTYDNLTLKTISMLEWVDNYCPKAAFVLKTDDDMFINVPRLLTFINKHNSEQRAIYGRLAKKWKPIRNKKSKYYISLLQYKPAVFPDFTTGPAYLFPAHISKELYTAALNHTYFKLEDVFVTGIVANSLKIKRIHAPEFLNKRVSLTPCSVQRGVSIHMIKGVEQYDLWKKVHDVVAKCKK